MHGNLCSLTSNQTAFLIVPEVTITKQSYEQTVAIDTMLWLGESGIRDRYAPDSHPLTAWEQSPKSSGFLHLAFPLTLSPRGAVKGYIAFRRADYSVRWVDPHSSTKRGVVCRIEFTHVNSREVIHEQEIEFHNL